MFKIDLSLKKFDFTRQEILKCVLENIGIKTEEVFETDSQNRRELSFFVKSKQRAGNLHKKLINLNIKGLCISLSKVQKDMWQNGWKHYLKPFKLTSTFKVVPLWMKDSLVRYSRKTIFIDTELVFGAGTHPTSQMTAQLIEKKAGHLTSFLDVGCGTGILSICAGRCGAEDIWAIDIDKKAIPIARRNFEINSIKVDYLKVQSIVAFKNRKNFDFIAANLLTYDLITLNKYLKRHIKKNGYIAVSGISEGNFSLFKREFNTTSLRCIKILKKDGWVALLYKYIG